MNCFWHPHTPAVAECTDCRKPLCQVCRVLINSRPYCEGCAVNHHQQSPLSAFLFGLLVPGLGQIYNGEFAKGLIIFLLGWLIVPWIVGIVDAVLVAQAIAEGKRPEQGVPAGYLVLALKIGAPLLSCLYVGFVWFAITTTVGVLTGLAKY